MNILSYPICVSRLPVGRHGGCKACGHAPRGAPHQNVPPFQTGGPAIWSQENNRWKPRKLRTVEHVETCLVGFNLINGDSNVETWQLDVIWSSTCWKPMVSLGHHLYECMFKWWFMCGKPLLDLIKPMVIYWPSIRKPEEMIYMHYTRRSFIDWG